MTLSSKMTFSLYGVSPRMDFQIFSLVMLFLACVEQSLASCVVDSFTVKEDFDPARVSQEISLLETLINP